MALDRRALLQASLATLAAGGAGRAAAAAEPGTLRVAFNLAETGFDPPQVSDIVSITVHQHIFESPLAYDHLARPAALVPRTALALPEVDDGGRRYVVTLRPGILFADDPAFGGRPRELVAQDYVYSIKRYYDPALKSEHLYLFENAGILGLSELRAKVLKSRDPFPYDVEVPGLRALDRHRFEVRLARPDPRFIHQFTNMPAVAREVVQAHAAADLMAHPVGTGPFRLASWRRSSRIVLERNPRWRGLTLGPAPADADADTREVAADLAGRTLPLLKRVEIQIIEDSQPRWLSFVGGDLDTITVPPTLAPVALQGDALAPYLRQRGVRLRRRVGADVSHTFFNCADPVIGGTTPAQVALRRAVALAYDNVTEVRTLRRGQAVVAQSMVPPLTFGHDAALRSESGTGGLARARALLDTYGFVPRAPGGWRARPDGTPLTLRLAGTADQLGRETNEYWRARMQLLGVDIAFDSAPFGELIKRSLAGQLMMWSFSWQAAQPDADFFLGLAYSRNLDQSNDARFQWPAYDRLYEAQRALPDGPERLRAIRTATRMMLAYMPYLPHAHSIASELRHAHVRGALSHPFQRDTWLYTDTG